MNKYLHIFPRFLLAITVLYFGPKRSSVLIDMGFISYWHASGLSNEEIASLGYVSSVMAAYTLNSFLFSFLSGVIIGKTVKIIPLYISVVIAFIFLTANIFFYAMYRETYSSMPFWYNLSLFVCPSFVIFGCWYGRKSTLSARELDNK